MKIRALLFVLFLALLAGLPLMLVGAAVVSIWPPQVVGIMAAVLAMAVAFAVTFWIRRRHDHTGHGVVHGLY
jgi:membrane protein implicated in regulation of membrane protease activity